MKNKIMEKVNKSTLIIVTLILFLTLVVFAYFFNRQEPSREFYYEKISEGVESEKTDQQKPVETTEEVKRETETIKVEETEKVAEKKVEIPEKVLINVDFLSQAPFGVWDEYHEDACEEVSLIMLEYFLSEKNLTNETGENEIQKMVKFQIENYGDFKDTSVAETVQIAKLLYGRNNLEVVYDFPKSRIKEELAKGNPIIVPAAGRLLGNPNYTPPGPLYHNLLVIGYDGDTIITNDPGTKRGAGYRYDIDVLYDAIHDFTGSKEDVLSGRKAMIIVK